MTSSASREMTEQEMINTSTAPQMAHLIQVLRQTIRNKDKEIEKWVDMVKQLQRDGELDPPEPKPLLADAKAGDLCMLRNGGYTQIDSVIIDELDPPEPKTLLADAKVGDLCQRRDGKWVQVDSYSNDRPCPVMCKSDIGGQDCFTLDGRNHNAVNNDKDIIATEPLAEVGTAEWAWQMAKLGIETRCYEGKIKVSKSGLIEVCYNGMAYAMPLTQSPDNKAYTIKKISQCSPTGWQLYEEPEFNVGDFVKYDIDTYLRVIEPSGKDKTLCKTLSGVIVYPYTSCLTKASPSEVIVKIGCLEGTVEKAQDYAYFLLWHSKTDCDYSMIKWDALDIPTRELVESLLRAQEEK